MSADALTCYQSVAPLLISAFEAADTAGEGSNTVFGVMPWPGEGTWVLVESGLDWVAVIASTLVPHELSRHERALLLDAGFDRDESGYVCCDLRMKVRDPVPAWRLGARAAAVALDAVHRPCFGGGWNTTRPPVWTVERY
ncbi:hypothetical protein [Kineococcus auxinigenes]|uniref:hypothetical protein n=1 Tax=unclassified Kineococcus TaxID=2621656 RepID=UPI003D7E3FAA